jgi:2-polyprenyl-6-methoxyphenol hydroxylase-like FAD-dependent oxidoreductase
MRVIVVGGGIGGLSTAIALRRTGHDVVVLERAPSIEVVGAGIARFANALRGLARLGVHHDVAALGSRGRRGAIRTCDGRQLSTMSSDIVERTIAIHRADLQAVLGRTAADLRLGAEVISVADDSGAVAALLADGTAVEGDLLIGADGVNSVVRRAVADARPRFAGYTAWRGVCRAPVETGLLSESWGVGERFGILDIGRSRTYWFATKNAPEGEPDEPAGRKAEILRRFAGWHDPIAEVAAATDEAEILRNDVYYLKPLERWTRGRVALLGDAAHATTPGIGQGAAQAIEDAVVLADQLAGGQDLQAALASYESIRRPRAELVLKLSRRADNVAQLANPVACRLRNAIVARLPERAQQRQLDAVVRHQV